MKLFIKIHDDLSCIDVETVEDLRALFPSYNFYHRSLLNTNCSLEHYGIEPNDTIHALPRLRGGYLPTIDGGTTAGVGVSTGKLFGDNIFRTFAMTKFNIDQERSFFMRIIENIKKALSFAKTMITIAKFFPIITFILMILAALGRPVEFLLMFAAMILTVIIYIVYSVLNLPPFIYSVMAIWFIIFDIIPFLIYCAVFGVIFAIITLICIFLTIINTITWGSLKNLVLCQSTPAAWYKVPNYQLDNKRERSFMCNRPCFSRYAPDATGMMCKKTPKGYPPYCPQAEIMRIYSRKKSDRKYVFSDYNEKANVKYLSNRPDKREAMLKSYYMNKRNFRESCREKMSPYDPVTLNICASIDTLDLPKKHANRLRAACAQAYCSADKNYPFCNKVSGFKETDENLIIKKIVRIITIIIIFCIVFIFCMESLYRQGVK